MKVANVYIEHSTLTLDRTFMYNIDNFNVERGTRVKVKFGYQSLTGFVESISEINEKDVDYEILPIEEVVDTTPLLNEELMELGKFMSEKYVCSRIACYQSMLPKKLKPKTNNEKIKYETWVRYAGGNAGTPKQQAALDYLIEKKEVKRSEWVKLFKTVCKTLIDKNVVEEFLKEAEAEISDVVLEDEWFDLTNEQRKAIDEIENGEDKVYLIHGVTGSGKTEVFLQLAKKALLKGLQVLVLVPEISLTPQMVKRVKARFGNDVAIYHSALNDQEKYEQFQLVKNKKVSIVVGTRSAVFMPFENLGYIIMDEEHDGSYKQDSTPRYHTRDIALERGKHHGAKVILASATPSLESYARAFKGVYHLVEMKNRVSNQMPKVHLVDMKKAMRKGESYLLSDILMQNIYERLQRKEQVILLLNRRGYTPVLRCMDCGEVLKCPHCDIALSYHKEKNKLKCHICDYEQPLVNRCPSCFSTNWKYIGMGTQRLEEFVQAKFPSARILRMDADTTNRKNAHETILKAFGNYEADILIGTQMIAKGLDYEKVTLVGIVNGDAMLNRNDYRSVELTFDLLTQASGRSGRKEKKGEVFIQVYDPEHYAITCAAHHDYKTFFQYEMQYRHLAKYPPFTYLASLVFTSLDEEISVDDATYFASELKKTGEQKVLGPVELLKIKDKYRTRILLKSKNDIHLQKIVRNVFEEHMRLKKKSKLEIDMYPTFLD